MGIAKSNGEGGCLLRLRFVTETKVEARKMEVNTGVGGSSARRPLKGFEGLGGGAGFSLGTAEREQDFRIVRHLLGGAIQPSDRLCEILLLEINIAENLRGDGECGLDFHGAEKGGLRRFIAAGKLKLEAEPGEDLA